MPRLPQNAYSDLLDRLLDDAIRETGTPVLRTIRGRSYRYARSYVGEREKEKYLGPDAPALRERIDAPAGPDRGPSRTAGEPPSLVQVLRVKGVPRIDAATGKVLQALAGAGVFRLRGVLIGTHAFRIYPLILGVVIPEAQHATEDIDLAQFQEISVALDDEVHPSIQEALAQVGRLTPAASLYRTQPTGYRVADTLVEILTPNRGPEREESIELPALGAHPKPLRFLDFLLAEATPAVPYRSGVLVSVPQPACYAVRKLIVSTRRFQTAAAKARKDVEQAMALVRVLAHHQPDELARLPRGQQPRRAVAPGAHPGCGPHAA